MGKNWRTVTTWYYRIDSFLSRVFTVIAKWLILLFGVLGMYVIGWAWYLILFTSNVQVLGATGYLALASFSVLLMFNFLVVFGQSQRSRETLELLRDQTNTRRENGVKIRILKRSWYPCHFVKRFSRKWDICVRFGSFEEVQARLSSTLAC